MRNKRNQHIQDNNLAHNRAAACFENSDMPVSEQKLVIKKIVAWMNDREFFWLMDIRTEFNIGSCDTKTNKLPGFLGKLVTELRRKNNIICTEVKKGQKQFMRTTIIDIESLAFGSRLNKNEK